MVLKHWFVCLRITPTLPQHSHSCDSLMSHSPVENQHIISHLSNQNLKSPIYYVIICQLSTVGDAELALFCELPFSPLVLPPVPNIVMSYFQLDSISLHVNAFLSWAMHYTMDTFLFCLIFSLLWSLWLFVWLGLLNTNVIQTSY